MSRQPSFSDYNEVTGVILQKTSQGANSIWQGSRVERNGGQFGCAVNAECFDGDVISRVCGLVSRSAARRRQWIQS